MTDAQIRYARTVDGLNIGYYTTGEGVPLVLMNLPLSNLQFELGDSRIQGVRAAQARNTRVVRYDHRGIGVSDRFEGEFTTEGFVQDLEAVVDKLDLQRFFLVAVHSFAYPIALTYAALHPDRVISMAAVLGGSSSAFASSLADLPDAGWRFISDTIARRMVGADDAEGADTLAEELRQSIDLDGLKRVSQWAVAAADKVQVESVKTPCLFLPTAHGEVDWVGKARSLASRMENAAVQPLMETTLTASDDEARDAITSFFTRGRGVPRVEAEPPTSGSAVILFTDIVSSTELTESMGDAAFRDASRALDAGLRAAIRDAGGDAIEGKLLGDGVLATFGSAAQAIEGARRCLALSAASELGLHIGLHAGDVIREEVDGRRDVFGGAVNIASRICGLSAPGEILVSDVVRGMGRSSAGVEFEDRGEHEMKGVGEPVRVYAVRPEGVRTDGVRGVGLMVEPEIRYCTTSDGVSIAYYAIGEGPPMVVTSGILFSNLNQALLTLPEFYREGTGFGRGQRFVRYDARGSGMSDRSMLDFSIEARIRDLEAVVDHLALEPFDLISIAHGVVTAIAYAARHPERVRNLILVDGYARGAPFAELPSVRAYSSFRNIAEESWEAYTLAIANQNLNFSDSERAQVLAARLRDSMNPPAVRGFYDALPSLDVTALLPRIVTPTMVISAKGRTVLDPEWSRELASKIPGARFVTKESSELIVVDDAVVAIVEEFLGIDGASNAAQAAARPEAGAFRTVLFTDIVGHTEMMSRLGDTKGRDVLREHERITRETLKAHGGAEVKTMGDGFMASFGSVTSAMECAIALQRAFASHTESMPEPLHVRVGLNAGEPIEEDGDLFGATVILASRIAAKAGAGEILVPDTVRGLLSGKQFLFSDRGEFVPKGFDDAVRLYEVRWRE